MNGDFYVKIQINKNMWESNKIKAARHKYEYDNFNEIDDKFKEFDVQQGDSELNNTSAAFGTILIQTAEQGLHMTNVFQSQGQPLKQLSQRFQLTQLNQHLESVQMNSKIDTLPKNWCDKIFLKKQKYKETDQQMKKEKIYYQTLKHFQSLQLKTKYEQLQIKINGCRQIK
ncbi:unnamed protein product [Paramecium sonneborni]|uniref:Uncharacterized protein n=1 Tax=Paramecium sonneborni TaxID=65129 RepID=A0A8S1LX17_9CILI|nr:unnamed protein product [Paramecium sonneborni]